MAKVRIKSGSSRTSRSDKLLERSKSAAFKVGLLRGLGAHPNSDFGMTIPEIGAINEFGGGNVPERSFIRATIRKNRTKYSKIRKRFLGRIFTGDLKLSRAISLLGTMVKSDIQKTITEIKAPPNSEETVDRKGSSNPLIDTGLMRKSVQWEKL